MISSPPQLVAELAARARKLRALARVELEAGDGGPLGRALDGSGRAREPAALADDYAQTVAYGLLAARWWARARGLGFGRPAIARILPSTSPGLGRWFAALLDAPVTAGLEREIDGIFELLAGSSVFDIFGDHRDPVIHSYQHFLDSYDPQLRKRQGVYSTPDEIVGHMVETVDAALRERFGLALGLADTERWASVAGRCGFEVPAGVDGAAPFVTILDPAVGTGAFLLRVIEVVHATMRAEHARRGLGADAARAAWIEYVRAGLLPRVRGFEIARAPQVVSDLRLGLALEETGFEFGPGDRLRIELCDTLEVRERERPITVILGNPPYEREAAGADSWVRTALLDDYVSPARAAGAGGHLKNLYNNYVYFWRWASWRVFGDGRSPGIVALITPSSYLRGPGFVGMREAMRRTASTIHVLDLEGEQRGARVSDNVFAITVPVCVTTLIRDREPGPEGAIVRYHRVAGSREDKLAACARWTSLAAIDWASVPARMRAPIVGGGTSDYRRWPLLTDLWPWQHSGVQYKRTWPIAETPELLRRRWAALLGADDRAAAFHETPAWTIAKRCRPLIRGGERKPAIAELPESADCPAIHEYGFRSFDRQYALVDERLGDRLRPRLWRAHGPRQIYMTSLLSGVLGPGPAATISTAVPDLHHFRGSFGGKDVIPLWRDHGATEPNLADGLVEALAEAFGVAPEPEELFAYTYAVLANPGYVERFADELQVPGPRIPITRDPSLFQRGVALGRELLRWHGCAAGLSGAAAVVEPIPDDAYPERHHYDERRATLKVGVGTIAPVAPEVWGFSVSGLAVVKSWLDYRMLGGAGRRSSPLDELRPQRWTAAMTRGLLELLWVLEWTVECYVELDGWFDEVRAGELRLGAELPSPSAARRRPPQK